MDQCDANDIVQDDAKCDECGASLRGTECIRLRPKQLQSGGKWFCEQHVPFEVIDEGKNMPIEEIHGVKIPWLKSDPNDPTERQRPAMKPCKPGYTHVWDFDDPEPDMKRCPICGHSELMTYCPEGTEHEWVADGDGGYHCGNCDEQRWDQEEHERWLRGVRQSKD